MNLEALANTTWEGKNETSTPDKSKYLLSAAHLNLTIISFNEIQPQFEWYASNITPDTIEI